MAVGSLLACGLFVILNRLNLPMQIDPTGGFDGNLL
jgi:hypothetical protein